MLSVMDLSIVSQVVVSVDVFGIGIGKLIFGSKRHQSQSWKDVHHAAAHASICSETFKSVFFESIERTRSIPSS